MKIKKARKSKKREDDIFDLAGGTIFPWITREGKIVGFFVSRKNLAKWERGRNKDDLVSKFGEKPIFKEIKIRLYPYIHRKKNLCTRNPSWKPNPR